MKNDKDVVLAAVEEHRLALQHASEELKKNKDVVTAAVEKDPRAFTFASEELKKDISFVKTVVQLKPKALEFAADALKQNKDVASWLPSLVESVCQTCTRSTQKQVLAVRILDTTQYNDTQWHMVALQFDLRS